MTAPDAMRALLGDEPHRFFDFRIERFNKPTIVPGTDTWGTRPVVLTIDNASGLIVRETPEYGDLP